MILKKPLVSIILTYFNKRMFVDQTLKSILNQTYKNYELIFVYDNSNNEDLEFIKNKLKKFKRKKLIINKYNLGVAKSRNKALRKCSGNYVAFIDSDDIWRKVKLSKQIKHMVKNSLEFCFTSYEIISEKNNRIGKRKVNIDGDYEKLYKSNYIGLSTVIFNKKIANDFKFPILQTQEDFALWLLLLRKGYKLNHFNPMLSKWRKTKKSLSSNIFQKLVDAFKLYYFYENKNFIFSIYSVLVLSYNKFIKN